MANLLISSELGLMRALRKLLRAEGSPQIAHMQNGEGKWTWSATKLSYVARSGHFPCSYLVRGQDTKNPRMRVDMRASAPPNLRQRQPHHAGVVRREVSEGHLF